MRLSFAENPVRAVYGLSLSSGLIVAYVAGCWGRFESMPWLLPGLLVVVLLGVLPWLGEGDLPAMSYTTVLSVLAEGERESATFQAIGRLVLLVVMPGLMGMMAMYRPGELDFWLYGYLAVFAVLGILGQQRAEGLMTNLMAGFGFVFLASLRGGTVNLVLGPLAAILLLQSVAGYLLMTNYPDDDNPAAWTVVRVCLVRNVGIFLGAGLLAFGGTVIAHNVWNTAYEWLGLGEPLPQAGPDASWLSGGSVLRLVVYFLLAILTVFLMMKLIAVILRQRRSLKAGRLPRILEQTSDPGGEKIDYAMRGDWEGYRRQIIATYLKTRSSLGKLGYGVRISTTPEDYTVYLGRRVREAYEPMWELTLLFLTARYSQGPLAASDPSRARELQAAVVRAVKSAS